MQLVNNFEFSGIFGIIAAAIYTGFSSPQFGANGYTEWGIGFIYSWVCPGALFLANGFHGLAVHKTSDRGEEVL